MKLQQGIHFHLNNNFYRIGLEIATLYPRDIEDYILASENIDHSKDSISSFVSETSSEQGNESPNFPTKIPYELSIIRRFDFDSRLARMSVIVKN